MAAAPENYQHKLYVIQDGTLQTMANDDRFLREFPFLRNLRTAKAQRKGCGTCGGSNLQRTSSFQSAKATIAGMGQSSKLKLKRMLAAKQVRVRYTQPGGKTVELTF